MFLDQAVAPCHAWLLAFFATESKTILRTYRLDSYFGKGLQITIVADASPWGIGGYVAMNNTVMAYFADKVTAMDEQMLHVKVGESSAQQVVEALAVLVALKMWRHY